MFFNLNTAWYCGILHLRTRDPSERHPSHNCQFSIGSVPYKHGTCIQGTQYRYTCYETQVQYRPNKFLFRVFTLPLVFSTLTIITLARASCTRRITYKLSLVSFKCDLEYWLFLCLFKHSSAKKALVTRPAGS